MGNVDLVSAPRGDHDEIIRSVEWPAPLTARDVAAELGCTEDDVRALIREGELETVACGVRPGLVPRHRLDAYLRRVRPPAQAADAADRP